MQVYSYVEEKECRIDLLKLNLWGRAFSLKVEYECYEGEVINEEQNNAVRHFASHPEWLEAAKPLVEDYCRKQVQADDNNHKKDNIFSYIQPIEIYVKNDRLKRLGIMCNYRYNEDDGIAIVFYPDGKISVGEQGLMA